MGWEFAALWNDDTEAPWQWVWRRIADDSGQVVEESRAFDNLDGCMADAKEHGFENETAGKL